MELTVALIGKPHGLRGEVSLDLRTDVPESRLIVGQDIATVPAEAGPLTITRTREAQGRWYVTFAQATDRTAVEALRGVKLVTEIEASDEEDAWYEYELQGLTAELADGTVVGKILGLEYLPAQDALILKETNGTRTLVPFLTRFVPVVDVAGGRVVLTPPGGLLSSDAANLIIANSDEDLNKPGATTDVQDA